MYGELGSLGNRILYGRVEFEDFVSCRIKKMYFTAIPGEGYRTLTPGTLVRFEVVDSPADLTARNVQKKGS
jgi:hypothetical protein